VALRIIALSLASQIILWTAGLYAVHATSYPGWFASCEGPLRWRMLLPGACSSLGWSEFFQRLNITGTYPYAILIPFMNLFDFNDLRVHKSENILNYGSLSCVFLP
jgi:hypothetical protein